MIKQVLEHVVKSLVENPDQVAIEVFHDGPRMIIEINVSQDDYKRIIGKEGRVIKTLRSLAMALNPSNQEVILDLVR